MYVSFETFKRNNKDLPDWYDELVHEQFINRYLGQDKLQAVKFLRETAKIHDLFDVEDHDLRWCKEKVDDLVNLIKIAKGEVEAYGLEIRDFTHDPVLVNNVVKKILDLKYVDGREEILTFLIKYVHPKILQQLLKDI